MGVDGGVDEEELRRRNVKQFRGGLVLNVHRLCVSLNSRLERTKEWKVDRGVDRAGQHFAVALGVFLLETITPES